MPTSEFEEISGPLSLCGLESQSLPAGREFRDLERLPVSMWLFSQLPWGDPAAPAQVPPLPGSPTPRPLGSLPGPFHRLVPQNSTECSCQNTRPLPTSTASTLQNHSCWYPLLAHGEPPDPLALSASLTWHVPGLSWTQTQSVTQAVPLCSVISPCVGPGQSLAPQRKRRYLSGDHSLLATMAVHPHLCPSAFVNLPTKTGNSPSPCCEELTAGCTSLYGLARDHLCPSQGIPDVSSIQTERTSPSQYLPSVPREERSARGSELPEVAERKPPKPQPQPFPQGLRSRESLA